MEEKYCKMCEPYPEMIDEDSIKSVGYYLKGKRKIHLCELCLEGQKKYSEIFYYDKLRNKKENEKICNHDYSNYEKKNLVTIIDDNGGYDIMKCNICGYEIKRYGLGFK